MHPQTTITYTTLKINTHANKNAAVIDADGGEGFEVGEGVVQLSVGDVRVEVVDIERRRSGSKPPLIQAHRLEMREKEEKIVLRGGIKDCEELKHPVFFWVF